MVFFQCDVGLELVIEYDGVCTLIEHFGSRFIHDVFQRHQRALVGKLQLTNSPFYWNDLFIGNGQTLLRETGDFCCTLIDDQVAVY